MPTVKTRCSKSTRTKNGRVKMSFRLDIIKNGITIKNPRSRLKKLVSTEDRGINSRGKENCFKRLALLTIDLVASCKELLKNNQGNIPEIMNR